jgi:hypothetical protein
MHLLAVLRLFRSEIRAYALLLLIFGIVSPPVHAQYESGKIDFSFDFGYLDYQWLYNDGDIRDTKIQKLHASWLQPLTPWLLGGLQLAYLDLTQTDNPLPSGQNTNGWGLGLTLGGRILDSTLFQTTGRLSFDYQTTLGESSDQSSDISWSQITGGLDFVIRPVNSLDVLAGAEYTLINGSQDDSGTVDSVSTFKNDQPIGYYGGLRLNLGSDGAISLQGYWGGRNGYRMAFSRQF